MSRSKHHLFLAFLIIIAAVVFAVVMIALRPSVPMKKPPVPVPYVDVLVARPVEKTLYVDTYGTVQAAVVSQLVAEVSGRVEWISPAFVDGGFFRKGDTLLRIEDDDYRLGVAQAETQLAQAELALARERQSAETAEREWLTLGSGTPAPLAMHRPQIKQAEAAVGAAREALQKARRDLARTRISAPFDGRIQKKFVDMGQFINRGFRLADIYGTAAMEVRLPVSERQLAFVDLPLREGDKGPRVFFHADIGGRKHQWIGRIVRTEGLMDPQTRMIYAVGRVDDPLGLKSGSGDIPLMPGMYVEADIEGKKLHDVYVLPRIAVRDTNRIYVIDESDRLRIKTIHVLKSGEEVIVDDGLSPGERICLSYLSVVTDGMPVKPLTPAPEGRRKNGDPMHTDEVSDESSH